MLSFRTDVPAMKAELFVEAVAQGLERYPVEVSTPARIGALLGRERQRALLGCDDGGSSCAVELAGALGSEAVLTGVLVALGEPGVSGSYQLQLTALSGHTGKAVATVTARAASLDALLEDTRAHLPELAQALVSTFRPAARLELERAGARRLFWVPAVAAVAFAGASAVLLGLAHDDARRLATDRMSADAASGLVASGELKQGLGVAAVALGVAALLTTAGLLVFNRDLPARLVPTASAGGGSVWLLGEF